MRRLNEKITGDVLIANDDAEINGVIAGNLSVGDNAAVDLNGMVCGNVYVKAGLIRIHGMVTGDVVNEGGDLTVSGVIQGRLLKLGGKTAIDSKAVINL